MDEKELIRSIRTALHDQHSALDYLAARLMEADPSFRPTQQLRVWSAVTGGHAAIQRCDEYLNP